MSSRREAPSPGRGSRLPAPPPLFRTAIADAPEPGLVALRRLLLERWPGWLLLGGLGLKLVAMLVEWAAGTTIVGGLLGTLARLGIIVGGAIVGWWLFQRARTRLLWRVRERLIVSYLFIGVVPALLIAVFFLFGMLLLVFGVSAYLFTTTINAVTAEAQTIARAAAEDLERSQGGASVQAILDRHASRGQLHFPGVSFVLVPRQADATRQPSMGPAPAPDGRMASLVRAGAWTHMAPPDRIPAWIKEDGVLSHGGGDDPIELVVRAVARSRSQDWSVVVDVPLDEAVWTATDETTGIQMVELTPDAPSVDSASGGGAAGAARVATEVTQSSAERARFILRYITTRTGGKWVFEPFVFIPIQDWVSESTATAPRADGVTARIRVAPVDLLRRLASAQGRIQGQDMATLIALVLVIIVVLFLVIEGAALAMGWALARSITGSVHALFHGTERLRLGDLGHRIPIRSRDQLGELAESFNAMTANIETLLEQAAEKRRLEEELRIAREIQMSLLPRQAAPMPGLALAALCVPAREVGGDYYDFFALGPRRLGLLVADVAGKGTSAALYMAELKGLMLSLSQIHESPRTLLIEVNRIIAANLDSRSFITMMYAVVDLERRTLTYARAGHTPLIHRSTASPTQAELVAPSGMVVGLQIDGLEHRFAELLEEVTVPLVDGDVFLLYTDGLSEAMNAEGDLFGEERLRLLVEEHGGLGSDGLRERIVRDVEAHVGGADPHDDMTLIVVTVDQGAGA